MIDGNTLIALGFAPGKWFKDAIAAANAAEASGADAAAIRRIIEEYAPPPVEVMRLRAPDSVPYHRNIRAEDPVETENIAGVDRHMRELLRVPTVRAGAVMPDACVSGSQPGTIPVGGVIAAENAIHPGMHSADICCSMTVTMFAENIDPKLVLDAGMALSHFGPGGRPAGQQIKPPDAVMAKFAANPFLSKHTDAAAWHFGTQGDGNHFFFVGRVASTGKLALVTHHGSRKPGALLYAAGMEKAEKVRAKLSPETAPHNAWIPADSDDGRAYWDALQAIRAWTKANHIAIHDLVMERVGGKVADRFWNEHNFVFRRSDGLYYHGKGATPAWADFASDSSGLTLIPLNMAEPVLIARGRDAAHGLGFSPHGAGRNLSRSAYMRGNAGLTAEQMIAGQAPGIDVRFFSGVPDTSELPGAYKNAAAVRAQIDEFGLADVVDTIEPIGSIMAGDWQRDAPWRKKKAAKAAAKAAEE
jgi:tRNA-splicing ligase RtcB (3'-phosphate/5'-hydroxy nucleic acid ligase)